MLENISQSIMGIAVLFNQLSKIIKCLFVYFQDITQSLWLNSLFLFIY